MPEYDLTIAIIGKDSASGVFGEIEKSLRNITETALGVAVGRMFIKIGEDILYLAGQAINATAQIQMMQVSLQALAARELVKTSNGVYDLANAYEAAKPIAKATMDELARISILSPYTVAAVQNTFRLNTAFGFTFKQATQLTEGLLNMAAGVGADNEQLKRMSYNLSQIRLQGKVTAMDIRQLALAGLDLRDVLKYVSKQMGYNIKDHLDFNQLIKEGKIDWDLFAKYFNEYATKYFGKAAENMARTLLGLKSTFSDVFVLTLPQIVGDSVTQVVDILNALLNTFLKLRDAKVFEDIGKKFSAWTSKWLKPVKDFADALNVYLKFWDAFDAAGGVVNDATREIEGFLVPMGAAPSFIGAVQYALEKAFGQKAVEQFNNLVAAATDFGNGKWLEGLKKIGLPQSVVNFITDVKLGLINLKAFWDTNGKDIMSIFSDISSAIIGFIVPGANTRVEAYGKTFEGFTKYLIDNGPKIVQKLGEFRDFLKTKLLPDMREFFDKLGNEWLPKLTEFVNKLVTEWLPKLGDFFTKMTNEWIPAAFKFAGVIVDNWVPVAAVIAFLTVTVLGMVAAWSLVTTIIPVITSLVAIIAIMVTLPAAALTAGLTALALVALVLLGAVAGLAFSFMELAAMVALAIIFWPQLQAVWAPVADFLNTTFVPALQATYFVFDLIWAVGLGVLDVFTAIGEKFAELVTGAFFLMLQTMVGIWVSISGALSSMDGLNDAFDKLTGPTAAKLDKFFNVTLVGGVQSVINKVLELIEWLHTLADKIRNIDLGPFEHHSPSPFEISVMGINKQLREMNRLLPGGPVAGSSYTTVRGSRSDMLTPNTTYYFAPVTLQANPDQDMYSLLEQWRR